MQQSVAKAGMVRRAARAICALLAMVASLPALAGDRALIEVIGYSPDGAYLAFEEFGVQDGSGFAYSSIYIIDLAEDAWVVGTPIRAQASEEAIPLTEIRAQAQSEAEDDLATLGITVPAQFLALIGDGVPDNDGSALSFGRPGLEPGTVTDVNGLTLSQFGTRSAAPCQEWFDSEPVGYELSLSNDDGTRIVHRDTTLPRSRGCPVEYRLYGVLTPFQAADAGAAVAVLSVYTYGFEGPDRRFLAVPLGL